MRVRIPPRALVRPERRAPRHAGTPVAKAWITIPLSASKPVLPCSGRRGELGSVSTHTCTAARATWPAARPLLKFQGDEKLVALTRDGHQHAFEALVERYQSRLLGFCRQMLARPRTPRTCSRRSSSPPTTRWSPTTRHDHRAPVALPDRPQPLPQPPSQAHPRGPGHDGHPPAHERDHDLERVQNREEFRNLLADVTHLPETQRSALLLREIDAMSYEEIAQAMDTTVPGVKSLLVRARIALAESSQARQLTCGEVRLELAEAAEGLRQGLDGPARRTSRAASRCTDFRGQLRKDSKVLAALFPAGPLLALKGAIVASSRAVRRRRRSAEPQAAERRAERRRGHGAARRRSRRRWRAARRQAAARRGRRGRRRGRRGRRRAIGDQGRRRARHRRAPDRRRGRGQATTSRRTRVGAQGGLRVARRRPRARRTPGTRPAARRPPRLEVDQQPEEIAGRPEPPPETDPATEHEPSTRDRRGRHGSEETRPPGTRCPTTPPRTVTETVGVAPDGVTTPGTTGTVQPGAPPTTTARRRPRRPSAPRRGRRRAARRPRRAHPEGA